MPVYAKKVSTTDRRFTGRSTLVVGMSRTSTTVSSIPVEDTVVLCNGCNQNLHPGFGFLVYLGKRELAQDRPYDIFCEGCLKRYFPKVVKVDS